MLNCVLLRKPSVTIVFLTHTRLTDTVHCNVRYRRCDHQQNVISFRILKRPIIIIYEHLINGREAGCFAPAAQFLRLWCCTTGSKCLFPYVIHTMFYFCTSISAVRKATLLIRLSQHTEYWYH